MSEVTSREKGKSSSSSQDKEISSRKKRKLFVVSSELLTIDPDSQLKNDHESITAAEIPSKMKKKKKRKKETVLDEENDKNTTAEISRKKKKRKTGLDEEADVTTRKHKGKKKLRRTGDVEVNEEGGVITIGDIYRLPDKDRVPPLIYSACQLIFEEKVPVSEANKAYQGHCVPNKKSERKELRRSFNVRFAGYYEEQDSMILERFSELMSKLQTNGKDFLELVKTKCSGKDQSELHQSMWGTIDVRNIIGLYVGQDITNKIAFTNYNRLLKLVLDSPILNKYTPVEVKKTRKCPKWTHDEDKVLLSHVLHCHSSVERIDQLLNQQADWDEIASTADFPDRSGKSLREHWQRSVYPALVDELEPRENLLYKKQLLQAMKAENVRSRTEVDWEKLEKMFWPKTRAILVRHFEILVIVVFNFTFVAMQLPEPV